MRWHLCWQVFTDGEHVRLWLLSSQLILCHETLIEMITVQNLWHFITQNRCMSQGLNKYPMVTMVLPGGGGTIVLSVSEYTGTGFWPCLKEQKLTTSLFVELFIISYYLARGKFKKFRSPKIRRRVHTAPRGTIVSCLTLTSHHVNSSIIPPCSSSLAIGSKCTGGSPSDHGSGPVLVWTDFVWKSLNQVIFFSIEYGFKHHYFVLRNVTGAFKNRFRSTIY